jgi:nucleotide-binding universal stress UspA family protein
MLPVDGSEDLSMKAVQEGIALARTLGSRLTLLTVVAPYHSGVGTMPLTSEIVHEVETVRDEEHRKRAEKTHADIMASATAGKVDCKSLVVIGESPSEQIIGNAQALGCDLIVMASHGRKGLDAFLTGSQTVNVLAESRIPVLVVR